MKAGDMHGLWRRGWLGLMTVLVLAVPAAGALADGKPKIVATFSIIGDLVQAVGGDAVTVTTLVGPDGDAHVFEPKPSDLAAVASADLVVANGLGMEPWLERLTEAAGYQGSILIASQGVIPLPFKEEVNSSGQMPDDPHAFQDLANGRLYVKNIAATLATLTPKDAAAIAGRAATLDAAMAALDLELKTKLGALPAANRHILTSHDAFHYFAKAYGLDIQSIEGVSTDTEPSAADLAAIARQARSGKVKAIFLENMSNPLLARTISSESGVPVGGELVADALTKPDGLAPHYLDMFHYNLSALLKVLQ
jgi:zinc/manganese transport system substrate-binding protein